MISEKTHAKVLNLTIVIGHGGSKPGRCGFDPDVNAGSDRMFGVRIHYKKDQHDIKTPVAMLSLIRV